MPYDPNRHHRRSIRLKRYDYSQAGLYFVTICTQDRLCLFGEIVDGEMVLSEWGRVAYDYWDQIPQHFPHVELDMFVVMPNHIHEIVAIADDHVVGATHASPLPPCGPKPGSLGAIIGAFKSAVTKRINLLRGTLGAPIWQRNYHEHIIRNEQELERIRSYIAANPAQWDQDPENPQHTITTTFQDDPW